MSTRKSIKQYDDGDGEQGICPCCGSGNLTYESVVDDDNGVAYPWRCDDCGATGRETYEIDFIGHFHHDE